MIVLYIVLIILALLITVSLIPARFVFLINSDGTTIDLGYAFFKSRLYPTQKPKNRDTENKETKETENKQQSKKQFVILKDLFDEIIKTSKQILHYIFAHAITIEELTISATVGTSDPADTGMVCGSAYAAIFQVLGFMKQNMKLKKHSVDIIPDFDNCVVKGGLHAILHTNLAHVLIISFMLLPLIIKYKLLSRRIKK